MPLSQLSRQWIGSHISDPTIFQIRYFFSWADQIGNKRARRELTTPKLARNSRWKVEFITQLYVSARMEVNWQDAGGYHVQENLCAFLIRTDFVELKFVWKFKGIHVISIRKLDDGLIYQIIIENFEAINNV